MLRLAADYGVADRLNRNALVRGIGSRLVVQLLKAGLPAFVVQRDHFPKEVVEHRAAGTPALRRCPVVHAGDFGYLPPATWWSLMVEQLVVLARKSKIMPARMPNDVNRGRWLGNGKLSRDRQRIYPRYRILQAQDGGIVAVRRGGPDDF